MTALVLAMLRSRWARALTVAVAVLQPGRRR
jgi:hypothetical protein